MAKEYEIIADEGGFLVSRRKRDEVTTSIYEAKDGGATDEA